MMGFRTRFRQYIDTIKAYNRIAGITRITRRYFAINGFDGVITSIGILLGNYIIDVTRHKNVLIAGMAVIISLGVSGVWSAYNSESAERKKELDDLSESTLYGLEETVISRAQRFAAIFLSAVNGFSPTIMAFIPLIPFLFGSIIPIQYCYWAGFGLAFLILFGMGIFLGKVSRTSLIVSGLKMLIAGGICVGLSLLLTFLE
jgi:predicted membrane protein (TIGR00267 family)